MMKWSCEISSRPRDSNGSGRDKRAVSRKSLGQARNFAFAAAIPTLPWSASVGELFLIEPIISSCAASDSISLQLQFVYITTARAYKRFLYCMYQLPKVDFQKVCSQLYRIKFRSKRLLTRSRRSRPYGEFVTCKYIRRRALPGRKNTDQKICWVWSSQHGRFLSHVRDHWFQIEAQGPPPSE